MNNRNFIPRDTVVRIALITELTLVTVSALWIWFADLPIVLTLNYQAITYGVATCIPMLICNILIFGFLSKDNSPYPVYGNFKRTVVLPLCGNLNVFSALVLALCSGVAEELFFRGALFSQLNRWCDIPLSAIIVSALFAYVHLIGVFKRYWQIAIFYFLFGLYFCAILVVSDDLISAIVSHALYNFCAILYLRYVEIPKNT